MFNFIKSKCGKYLYAEHNPSIRADLKGNVYGGGCFDKPEVPELPTWQTGMPEWAKDLPTEILSYLRGEERIGEISEPAEYDIASQHLQKILDYQPEQFQLPIDEIQQALAAQQVIQMEQYQKQIRPTLAAQGQLDSSYYTNLLSHFAKGQQAQTYGTTADLLTQQALTNQQIQQWLPQFQAGVAGQLGGVGSYKAAHAQQERAFPYQSYIPGMQQMYGMGQSEADRAFQEAMAQWQLDYEEAFSPSHKEMIMSKMMSQLDPAGSYMGTWENPYQKYGESAQSMQGLGKAIELYSAWKGMAGGMGGGGGGGGMGSMMGGMMGGGGGGQQQPMQQQPMQQQYGYQPYQAQIPTSTIYSPSRVSTVKPLSLQGSGYWGY